MREENPALGVIWYADGKLHLDHAVLDVEGIRDMTRLGNGVVYGDDEGRVVYAADDGSRLLLGHKDPDVPVAATDETGRAAWYDPDTEQVHLVDARTGNVILQADVDDAPEVVAVDGDVVYLVGADGARALLPTGSTSEIPVSPADLLDVRSRIRVFQKDPGTIQVVQSAFNAVFELPGVGADLSPDGDLVATHGPDGGVVAATTPAAAPSCDGGLGEGAEVLAVAPFNRGVASRTSSPGRRRHAAAHLRAGTTSAAGSWTWSRRRLDPGAGTLRRMHSFRQVDVFGSAPLTGNPVAVVHDADDLDDAQMQLFAQWTNLSETTFLLRPTTDEADYRLRIFTPSRELPFAGHPTLGSAHAWLEAGGTPHGAALVQECAAGLVDHRARGAARLPGAAAGQGRTGGRRATWPRITAALGISADDVVDAKWVDNGPGWVGVLLDDARAVLAAEPGPRSLRRPRDRRRRPVDATAAATPTSRSARSSRATASARTRSPAASTPASASGWPAPGCPERYVAAQGTAIGRRGRVHVRREGSTVWVGGDTRTTLRGEQVSVCAG